MTMHLAEVNVGRLVAPTGDPRVAEFMAALDRVNGLGKRMPGFVSMMAGSGEPGTGNTEAKTGGDPHDVSNLTVWESVETLEAFVWSRVHRQFYARKAEWYEAVGNGNLVLWWVPEGHRPGVAEGMLRWRLMVAYGNNDQAFGWSHLKEARLWKTHGCAQVAAE